MSTNPHAIIRYYASNMILQVHLDVSYLTVPNARSQASGHYFLGSLPTNGQLIFLNKAIHALCMILKFVAASAAKARLGALFLNTQKNRNCETYPF